MPAKATAPSPPGLIDQIRDLIAKIFGWPRPATHGTAPVKAADADGPTT